MSGWVETWRGRLRALKRDAYALVLACRDRRTPWYARLTAGVVVAYTFSPIDLIPDFIPILGYLDDLILVPLGIALALKMIPEPVMAECRARAAEAEGRPTSRLAAVVVILIWIGLALLAGFLLVQGAGG